MYKYRVRRLGGRVIVTILVGSLMLLAVVMFRKHHTSESKAGEEPVDSVVEGSVTTSTEVAKVIDTSTSSTNKPKPVVTNTVLAPSDPAKDALQQQVAAFEAAYYQQGPQDTPETRRERIRPYVTPEFLASVDLGGTQVPSKGLSNADRAMQSKGITVSAAVALDQISGEFLDATTAEEVAIVTVSKTQGGETLQHREEHHTTWVLVPEVGWRVYQHKPPGTG